MCVNMCVYFHLISWTLFFLSAPSTFVPLPPLSLPSNPSPKTKWNFLNWFIYDIIFHLYNRSESGQTHTHSLNFKWKLKKLLCPCSKMCEHTQSLEVFSYCVGVFVHLNIIPNKRERMNLNALSDADTETNSIVIFSPLSPSLYLRAIFFIFQTMTVNNCTLQKTRTMSFYYNTYYIYLSWKNIAKRIRWNERDRKANKKN